MAEVTDSFPELVSVYRVSGSKINQMSQTLANIKRNSEQTGHSRTDSLSRNLSGGSGPRAWYPQNSRSNAWRHPNVIHKLEKWGNGESGEANGKSEQAKSKFPNNLTCNDVGTNPCMNDKSGQCKDDDDDDELVDSNSDTVYDSDDDLDLDDAEESHEARKKSQWFVAFFDVSDSLTIEEINSQARQWHCPACQGGIGAIKWYPGLLALMNHAKTIKARRARLHRTFAETLEEELRRRNVSITVAGGVYGRWEGLDKQVKDHEIVWPPMVVTMNTRYEQDENSKWSGMGNQELLDCFSEYAASKARHSYGPQGHRGMSVLIFEASTTGYLEAVRLHKHFKEQGRDREAWNKCQNPFVQGGKRRLYGYLASMEDMNIFNRHCGGKSKLKFEMRSYQEMVESKIKNINDDNQLVYYFKKQAAKEQIKSQALEASLSKVSQKLRQTVEENRLVRERSKIQHEEKKEEMDAQEQFFLDQIQVIQQAIDAKEEKFEKLQQEKREKEIQFCADFAEREDYKQSVERISSFTRLQDKHMRKFEAERDKLAKIHEDKKLALKKKLWQEEVKLEKEFENEMTKLMDKFTSGQCEEENGRQK
ncbi:protein SUPPRESSOR OF GENE SILENCING 3-like [Senna tora]|uniref:Protein SUPPRESSOR OF GENE SILENCING 3-like n=1 Tax=Senna tora TaxID=362788 RepID=A0A835CKS4_9FABA|nr:protein SUPPRESSOR OF GENE SILENCING 3-like [Senna tora]